MPVMSLFRSPNFNQLQYDAIVQAMDLEHQPRTGAVSHACGFDQNGICVVDVWESRQGLDAFLANRLKPAFAKLGIPFFEPDVMETYKFGVTDGADRYKLSEGPSFGAEREWPTAGGPTLGA